MHPAVNRVRALNMRVAGEIDLVYIFCRHALLASSESKEAYRLPVYKQQGLVAPINRVAAKSIAAIPTESIQFIGVAVLIADTGYVLCTACETVRDLDQLYLDLGMADEATGDAMHSICNPELPDAGEVWGGVVENMDQWWESLVEAV
jgi:hypothetical protein